jgi:hypothetical protein
LNPATSSLRLDFFEPPLNPAIFVAVGFFQTPFEPGDIFVAGDLLSSLNGPPVFCIARQMTPSMTWVTSPPTFIKYQRLLHELIAILLAIAMGSLLSYRLKPWVHCHFRLMSLAYCHFIGYRHGFVACLPAKAMGSLPFSANVVSLLPFYWLLPWVSCLFTG